MEMPGLGQGLSKAYITARVEDSLKRLQTDYIDLYQSHADDKTTPMEETLATYEQLIKQGKVRAIGASNFDAPRLAEALKTSAAKKLPRYETLQPLYNLIERADFEKELQGLCVKENVAVVPFYALASGFLTGKYRTKADLANRTRGSRVEKYLDDRGLRVLKALDEISARFKAKPAQVALAWLSARPSHRRADRQCHQPGAARRSGCLRAPQARRRRHQGPRHRERGLNTSRALSWSGLSRPSIYRLAPQRVDGWILGTSPRITMCSRWFNPIATTLTEVVGLLAARACDAHQRTAPLPGGLGSRLRGNDVWGERDQRNWASSPRRRGARHIFTCSTLQPVTPASAARSSSCRTAP